MEKDVKRLHLVAIGVLGFIFLSPLSSQASCQQSESNDKDSSAPCSVDSNSTSPLANAKIQTLNFKQALELGIPLGVLISPETAYDDDIPINNPKR